MAWRVRNGFTDHPRRKYEKQRTYKRAVLRDDQGVSSKYPSIPMASQSYTMPSVLVQSNDKSQPICNVVPNTAKKEALPSSSIKLLGSSIGTEIRHHHNGSHIHMHAGNYHNGGGHGIMMNGSSSNKRTNNTLASPSSSSTPPTNSSSCSSSSSSSHTGVPSKIVNQSHDFVHQMNQARAAHHFGNYKIDDYDPDSNVYVANLPSAYGKERLCQLFSPYGNIVRNKFVTPDEPTQPGYGFVQFANRAGAHKAIKALEGHTFSTGEVIYLSIALRRRSSLSDEPTNLYVKNLPSHWSNDKLRKVFSQYGQIRQSKVVGDGIAFVRYEDHEQALEAIQKMDKHVVETGFKLEVRFATRKTAANAYRLQQVPTAAKSNENNLYIRNLPKFYTQQHLEQLFIPFGKISSAKINENGIAFVRFAHGEDALRAIKELNGQKPMNFEEEIVVKLAHFDIGDSRNRWGNKFQGNLNGSGHFNNNVYQNHFNAPTMGHGGYNNHSYGSYGAPNVSPNVSSAPLSSVPSAVGSDTSSNEMGPMPNMMAYNGNNNVTVTLNSQMPVTQQQPHAQQRRHHQALINPAAATLQANPNQFGFAPQLMNPTLQSQQYLNPQAALSPSNNRMPNAAIFTKKQQALGDILYQKVFAKCSPEIHFAPKITGMLLKMGDQKAQQYIDNPHLLDEQIKIAKKLLQNSYPDIPRLTSIGNSIFPPLPAGVYSPAIPPALSIPNLLSTQPPFIQCSFNGSIPQIHVVSPPPSIPQVQAWNTPNNGQSRQWVQYEIDPTKPIITLNANSLSWGNANANAKKTETKLSTERESIVDNSKK